MTKNCEVKKKGNTICIITWIALCSLIVFYMIAKNKIGYESNDDILLSMIPSGFFGTYWSMTIYTSTIWGGLIAWLSHVFPICNWSTVYYLILIYCSYVLLGIWLVTYKGWKFGFAAALIFLICTLNSLINKMNYSKTCALAVCIGTVVAFSVLTKSDLPSRKTRILRVGSIALLFGGAILRKDPLLSFLPFFVLMVGSKIIRNKSDTKKTLIPVGLVTSIIVLIWCAEPFIYRNNDEWADFLDYNKIRSQLLDYHHGLPDYSSNMNVYEELGMAQIDEEMFYAFDYADDVVFSKDNLARMLEVFEADSQSKVINHKLFFRIMYTLIDTLQFNPFFFVMIFLFFAVVGINGRDHFWELFCTVIICMAELCYLIYKDRMPDRAIFIPIMMAMITVFYFAKPIDSDDRFQSTTLLVMIVLWSVFSFHTIHIKYLNGVAGGNNSETSIIDFVSENKENLYIWNVDEATDAVCEWKKPLDPLGFGKFSNSIFAGSWQTPSPIMTSISEKYGEKNNIGKLLTDHSNVFYVACDAKDVERMERYLLVHYNENAAAKEMYSVGKYKVYSFYQPKE